MKLKTWQILIVFGLSVVVPMLFVGAMVKAQDPLKESCKGNHPDRWDLYDNVRLLPPVTVSEIDGNRLGWVNIEKGIRLGSLELEPNYSIVPQGFTQDKHEGCFGIIYCHKHLVVLRIDPLPQAACK